MVQRRLASLVPLERVLADLRAAIRPVGSRTVQAHEAQGHILAEPIRTGGPLPPHAIALRDGWAVAAADIVGAASYSPVFPAVAPPWVETGGPLPAGTDAVLPPDGLSLHGGPPEIIASIAPGEGVRHAGGDAAEGAVLREPGRRVRPIDIAMARAAGIEHISVRAIRMCVFSLPGAADTDATGELVACLGEAAGATVGRVRLPSRNAAAIAEALQGTQADLLAVIGGTGLGHEDLAAEALAGSGALAIHGIAIRPGETAGCGAVGAIPVILVPGRFEAALGTMLTLVLPCLDHLMGAPPSRPSLSGRLTRKISSSVGITEIVLLRTSGQGLEPLATGDLTLAAIAAAEAWLAVPADSEGFAAGDTVAAFVL